MATTPLTKANCDVPGADGYAYHFYGLHAYEVLRVWRPDGWNVGAGFKNKACVVHIHGGLGHNPGNPGMNIGSGSWVQEMLETHGCPVVSIDYIPNARNSDAKEEPSAARLWPAHLFSCAKALSYVKTNAAPSTPSPILSTNIAAALWGFDANGDCNTIDPAKIVLSSFSYGSTIAALLAAVPSSRLPMATEAPLGRPAFLYAATPKPAAVVMDSGQIDWTQFAFNPTQTIGTYRDNKHQVFTYRDDTEDFGRMYGGSPGTFVDPVMPLHEWVKKDASPWWWAVRNYPELRDVGFVSLWPKVPSSDPDQSSLTHLDWSPGTQRIEQDLGKAWYDPHVAFQAKPWGDLLHSLGVKERTVWGNATTNPSPGLNRDDNDVDVVVIDFLRDELGLI